MHIKRFEAPTMLEAVRKVKEALGPDALVLSSRTLKKQKGVFGMMARSVVEVTAAVDREVRRSGGPEKGRVAPDSSWRELQLTRALVEPLETELREVRRLLEEQQHQRSGDDELIRDLGDLRRTTSDLARRWLPGSKEPFETRLVGQLLEGGLAARHAFLIGEDAERAGVSDKAALREILARQLDAQLDPPREEEMSPITIFVGPTGVGKTTTLAKIAARERDSKEGVALVTTDTQRIGAEDHLRTFSELLDVSFGVAGSSVELHDRVRGAGRRRVLVDTAGRSCRDASAIGELCRLREKIGRRVHVHLVLSATTKDVDLRREVDGYRPLAPDSLIITKMDESEDCGNVANLLLDGNGPPLRWLTAGQRVPEDLTVPDPRGLADRILGEMA
jgi:flagellar biosynthesis protein FlhF